MRLSCLEIYQSVIKLDKGILPPSSGEVCSAKSPPEAGNKTKIIFVELHKINWRVFEAFYHYFFFFIDEDTREMSVSANGALSWQVNRLVFHSF